MFSEFQKIVQYGMLYKNFTFDYIVRNRLFLLSKIWVVFICFLNFLLAIDFFQGTPRPMKKSLEWTVLRKAFVVFLFSSS